MSVEPTSAISQSAAEYNASRIAVQVEATVESLIQGVIGRNDEEGGGEGGDRSREEEDISSKELFTLLALDDRARVMRLLQWETTSTCDLSYGSSAGYTVQHASLKRLATGQWLNSEVINGFIVNYLRQKQNECSHIFLTHFMSNLLNTGERGTDPPNYTYENVCRWSRSIEGGLFAQRRIFVPINHQDVHWLSLCVDMTDKKISLWDPLGLNNANAIYTTYMLRYLGDEYKRAFPLKDSSRWLREWTIEDLSDECPQQENDCDCGIFLLLNLYCLLIDGVLSLESYSQATVDRKEVRKTVAHLLWKASSNHPVV